MKFSFFLFLILGGTTVYAASATQLKIIALGDSTTAGTPGFCSPRECPPHGRGDEQSQYAYWIMQEHSEWEILNQGVNGERSDQIMKRFDTDVLAHHPQAVIVLAGVNDLYQGAPVEFIQKNLTQIYERARQAGIRVLACTVLPYNVSTPDVKQKMKDLNEWIYAYTVKNKIGFCDTYHTVEDLVRPGNLASTPDGIHPDKEGYRKMGELIADCLEPLLLEAAQS